MSKHWDRVKSEVNLISLPNIYWRLKEVLERHDYSIQDVSQLITFDPGLTARILRIVNSAYFGFAAEIDTVNRAVSILGVRQIQDLILTTSIADALGDYECENLDVKQFWLNSIYRAIAARNLARECGLMDSERMFVAGLLSGIGHLIMYQSVPVLAQQAQRESRTSGRPLCVMERELIGFDHAQVGAVLMQNWKLPQSLVTVITNHLDFDPAADFALETAIVHIAALFGHAFTSDVALDELLVTVNVNAWDVTEFDIGRCEVVNAEVSVQLDGVVKMLFPKLR